MSTRIQRRLFAATFALVIATASCGGDSGSPSNNSGTPPAEPGVVAGASVSIPPGAMGLGTAAFGTNPLPVAPGTTVTWTNNDTIPHTTTSDDGLWDSGLLQPGQSFSFQFTGGGLFPYHCNIHGAAAMSGTVEVSGPAGPAPSPSPSASLTPTFTVVRDKILNPHCMSCHEGPSPSAGLDFTTWQNLVHNPVVSTLIVPGNPEASALYIHIQGGAAASSQEFMTAQEQQTIFNWIQSGAPNN